MVIDDFLSPEELETWRECVDRAVASRTGRTPSQLAGNKLFDSDPDDFVKGRPNEADLEKNSQGNAGYYASVFTQCLQLHMSDEGMSELMVDPSIGKMAAELAGVQGIRIWHDQALIKEPWANPTGFHLDNPYWSFDDSHSPHGGTLSLWVALDDATLDNGCLLFVPVNTTACNEYLGGAFTPMALRSRVLTARRSSSATPASARTSASSSSCTRSGRGGPRWHRSPCP